MQTARVVVKPYDEAWKAAFEAIKKELEAAVGEWIVEIQHVGSTSVEGMSAKPCIDIDIVMPDESVFDCIVKGLASIGYIHEGDLGIRGREAFKYENKPHLQAHHVYVCPRDSEELRRHLIFRDFLRQNPEAVRQYSLVKETAAKLFPRDINGYMAYKAPCIEELYRACGLQ